MKLRDKLVVGSVQFGLKYGIQDNFQVSYSEVTQILDYAASHKITTIDTAQAYGESEEVLGRYLRNSKNSFRIISKIDCADHTQVVTHIDNSMEKLGVKQLYGYMIHRFSDYKKNPQIFEVLKEYRKKEKLKKIGFSLYFPNELDELFSNNVAFDIIQVPYNLFDRRFEPYFSELQKRQIEIHTRSVFLQGLFFRNPETLLDYFSPIQVKLRELQQLAYQKKIPLYALCLNFVSLNPLVDRIVVGVHTVDQLKKDVTAGTYQKNTKLLQKDLKKFIEYNEAMLVPLYWPQ